MILDGNQRGGARDLAIHLMKPENEHIEIHEIRGFVADTIMGALREAEAVSRGTRCVQPLYSLSLSPPATESVPVAVFENAIERVEAKLGLVGHPRVVVFHEKQGRRHAHCVWSRINADTMKAVRMSHDRPKLGDISRQLYMEHGWRMPEGLIDPALRNPLNFDRKEWFQAKRAGQDPREIKAAMLQCWTASDSGKAFRHALESRGYYLARGDRGGVVAVDTNDEVYAVARWIGLKTKDVRDRMGGVETLPGVGEVRKNVSDLVREKLSGFADEITEEFAQASAKLEGKRVVMVDYHRAARRELQAAQEIRGIAEARRRAERYRKGLLGLWDRVTGKHASIRAQNEVEVTASAERDAAERQALIDCQLEERQRLQQDIRMEREAYARWLARLYRQLADYRHMEVSTLPEAEERQRRRRGRDMVGPAR